MTFCDGIPKTTAATNSGVTFEKKLDAMNLAKYFFYYYSCFILQTYYLSLHCHFSSQQQQQQQYENKNTTVLLTSTSSLSPGIKSWTEKNVSVLLKEIEAITYYKAILIKFKHSSGKKKKKSVYKIWESKIN